MKLPIALLFLLATQLANAAAKTWTGNTSTDWATATNWNGNTLPASGDDITIPTNPAGGRMPTISANYTIHKLIIQTGATLTHTSGVLSVIGGDTDITGTYLIPGGTYLTDKDFSVKTGGLVSQSGGTIHMDDNIGSNPANPINIEANGNFIQSAGIINTKDFTSNSGSPAGAFTQSGGTFRVYHDFKNKGIFTSSAGTIEFAGDGGGASFPTEVTTGNTQFNHVVINAGVDPSFTNQTVSFNVAGDWTNNSSNTDLSGKATTVVLNGTGLQTIGGTELTIFRNLTIDKPSGTVTITVNQSIKNGDLTITSGIIDLGTYTVNRTTSGGTLTVSNDCMMKLASHTGGQTGSNFPLNFTSFSFGSTSTVEYYGPNSVIQTIYAGPTYGNLTLTNSTGSGSATKITSANITVNGNLAINNNTVLNPGASYTVGGSGTLTGSGTAQVTRTTATADFNTQYPITNKTLTSLTVDYYAAAAQTVNAHNYYNLIISGTRTTNSVTLVNSGTIGVSGTFTPSASFTSGNYILTSSTVNFNGGAQNIPAFTFNNLTVTNGTKTATGIINVNAAFTLSSSVLTTTATNILILKDNATTSGASYMAYVNGPVRKVGNDAFTFPVGKSGTGYMFITISAPSLTTDAFTAEYMRSSATALGPITASGLFRVSNCDYWNLDRTTGSSSVDVTLSWNGYSNCNIAAYVTDVASLSIAHFNGTSWDTHGKNASTGNVSSGSITRNAVSVFSPFALGSSSDELNPLPIQFTTVKAYRSSPGNKVEWTNLTEENIMRYDIERSENGILFAVAGQITARENDGSSVSYEWPDLALATGTVYYRIKAVGINGKYKFSIVVKVDPANNSLFTLYPNPVIGNKLTVATAKINKGMYEIQVYDMLGSKIRSQSFVHNGATASYEINLPGNMKPGAYTLRIIGNNLNEVKTFLFR